jgi:hypothetical protein
MRQIMARGRKATTIRDEAGLLAEQMGYRWIANPHADLAFDFFMFRPAAAAVVKLKKIRNAILGDLDAAKKFPDEVAGLRALPFPPHVLRELWIRTQDDRCWRRFYIFPGMTGELGHNTAEKYKNRHVDEHYFDNAPYRIEIPIRRPGQAPAALNPSSGEDAAPGRDPEKATKK